MAARSPQLSANPNKAAECSFGFSRSINSVQAYAIEQARGIGRGVDVGRLAGLADEVGGDGSPTLETGATLDGESRAGSARPGENGLACCIARDQRMEILVAVKWIGAQATFNSVGSAIRIGIG